MNVWWIPAKCDDLFGDSKLLDRQWRFLSSQCRVHNSFKCNRRLVIESAQGLCKNCLKAKAKDAHHIRPIWSFAIDQLCSVARFGKFEFVDGDYKTWNAVPNLTPVCSGCHNKLEKEADRYWRETLLNKYHPHLCLNYAQAKKNFKTFWKDGSLQ